jgi:hypothetical protein
LLPTPAAADGERESLTYGRGNATLKGAVKLLPTPRERDHKGRGFEDQLPNTVERMKLLPTPAAQLHNYEEDPESFKARQKKLKDKGINGNGAGTPLPIAIKLLPTPMARSNSGTEVSSKSREGGRMLEESVKLLPTPHGMPKEGQKRRPGPSGNELGFAVGSLSTGETSSPRSDDGKKSSDLHLSPWFVEWMMGAPEGWSDPDCPLSATEFASRWGFSSGDTSSNGSRNDS